MTSSLRPSGDPKAKQTPQEPRGCVGVKDALEAFINTISPLLQTAVTKDKEKEKKNHISQLEDAQKSLADCQKIASLLSPGTDIFTPIFTPEEWDQVSQFIICAQEINVPWQLDKEIMQKMDAERFRLKKRIIFHYPDAASKVYGIEVYNQLDLFYRHFVTAVTPKLQRNSKVTELIDPLYQSVINLEGTLFTKGTTPLTLSEHVDKDTVNSYLIQVRDALAAYRSAVKPHLCDGDMLELYYTNPIHFFKRFALAVNSKCWHKGFGIDSITLCFPLDKGEIEEFCRLPCIPPAEDEQTVSSEKESKDQELGSSSSSSEEMKDDGNDSILTEDEQAFPSEKESKDQELHGSSSSSEEKVDDAHNLLDEAEIENYLLSKRGSLKEGPKHQKLSDISHASSKEKENDGNDSVPTEDEQTVPSENESKDQKLSGSSSSSEEKVGNVHNLLDKTETENYFLSFLSRRGSLKEGPKHQILSDGSHASSEEMENDSASMTGNELQKCATGSDQAFKPDESKSCLTWVANHKALVGSSLTGCAVGFFAGKANIASLTTFISMIGITISAQTFVAVCMLLGAATLPLLAYGCLQLYNNCVAEQPSTSLHVRI